MDGTIYCLVDTSGTVYVKDFAESHADVAAHFALNESGCQQYRFDYHKACGAEWIKLFRKPQNRIDAWKH